jgi:membrane fusion protein, multidrug efflux system
VGSIHEGQTVSFSVPAFPRAEFSGTVKFIGAALRESARDLIVEAEVQNADGKLKPGMFAEGKLVLEEQTAVTIPLAALQTVGSTHKVLVVLEERIEERLVEIGEIKDKTVEIRRGVVKGDAVVVSPGAAAVDGVKVLLVSQR